MADDELYRQDSEAAEKHYAAIGRVAAAWAEFEYITDVLSVRLARAPENEGACLTAQIAGSARKLDAYISLARERGASKKTIKDLCDFAKDTTGLQEQRNRIVHDQWMVYPSGFARRLEITARKKLIAEFIPHQTETVTQFMAKIREHISRLEDLDAHVLADMQALPGKSSLGTPG
jgi:hypothetical protein